MITRGRLLDRMRVAVAGSLATKMVLGEDTNFNIADIKRVRRMAERFVFYYGEGGGRCFNRRAGLHESWQLPGRCYWLMTWCYCFWPGRRCCILPLFDQGNG